MIKYVLILFLSCATKSSSLDYFMKLRDAPLGFCPSIATCKSESWNNVTIIFFSSPDQSGRMTFIDKKLKTVTLSRPDGSKEGIAWQKMVDQGIGKELVEDDGGTDGPDFKKKRNRLVSVDKKIVVETNDRGEYLNIHLAK